MGQDHKGKPSTPSSPCASGNPTLEPPCLPSAGPRWRPASRRGIHLVIAAAIVVVAGLAGCGEGGRDQYETTNQSSTETPSEVAPTGVSGDETSTETPNEVAPGPTAEPTQTGMPSGEVWQWAFGKNVWEDPLYTLSKEQNFSPSNTDIYANTMGFSLTPNVEGDVVIVTLFNEDTGMNAYAGKLPAGLDWSDTGGTLLRAWGPATLSGGYGIPLEFGLTNDGYQLTVSTSAMHQDELENSRITSITVRIAQ